MRHAVHQGLIDTNPAANLGGVTTPPVRRHYPALPLERLPELLERIGAYHQGRELTRLAVLLMLHVFIRSSELRFARWSEIDFTNRVWTIPASETHYWSVIPAAGPKCECRISSPLRTVHRHSETD